MKHIGAGQQLLLAYVCMYFKKDFKRIIRISSSWQSSNQLLIVKHRQMRSNSPSLFEIYNTFVQSPSTLFILQASPFTGLTCHLFDWDSQYSNDNGPSYQMQEKSRNVRVKTGLFSKVIHQLKQNKKNNIPIKKQEKQDKMKVFKSNPIQNEQSKYQFYFERDGDGNLINRNTSNSSENQKNTQLQELPFQQIKSETKSQFEAGSSKNHSIEVDFSFEEICANRQKNMQKNAENKIQSKENKLQSIPKPQIIRIEEKHQQEAQKTIQAIQKTAIPLIKQQIKQSIPKIVINYCNRELPKVSNIPLIIGSRPAQSHVIERVIQVEGSKQKIVDKSIKIDFDFDTNFI